MAPSGRPAPIQAIVGEDSYLAEAALAQVLAGAVGPDQQESVRVLYGDESRWEDVLAADTKNPAQPIIYLARAGRMLVGRQQHP